MSKDLTGRRLGHYQVEELLGRGGMSVMYRATDVRLGRKVALKVMGTHISGDAESRERFVDEARNTSAIDHANIVPLYDFGEVDGVLYIALRLVDGTDLAGLLEHGPISSQRTLELLGQIAEALDMLHVQGLVHLDLKPANVLVTSRESSTEHVYLADFGLTRRGDTGPRTSMGDFLGSPTYAAPEHLRGEPVDGRTDLYALSCVLFACLAGRPPFQGQVPEVIQAHLHLEPPPVTSFVVLPQPIDDVLRRGMAKNVDHRFRTCKELIATARTALAPAAWEGTVWEGDSPRSQTGAAQRAPSLGAQPVPYLPSQAGQPQHPLAPQALPHQAQHYGPPPQQPSLVRSGLQFPLPQGGFPSQGGSRQLHDPVRLCPPMPAQASSFVPKPGSTAKWLLPLLGAVLLFAIVAAALVLAGGASSTSEGVEPGVSLEPSSSNDLPTSVPTVER